MSYMKCPNMEAARLKIVAILKEHDLMGTVMIAGKERCGFFQEVSPSWSCALAEETPEGVGIRVRCQKEDYASAAEQQTSLALTVNGIMGMLHVHQYIGETLTGIVQMIGRKFDFRSVTTDQHIQKARAVEDRS